MENVFGCRTFSCIHWLSIHDHLHSLVYIINGYNWNENLV